jgi:glutamate-1-semialdehyde 2,1-aminomutase
LPVGAYGSRKEIMDSVSPVGKVYQAGTLSGNPIAMAAGYAMLTELNENPQIYQKLEQITQKIVTGLKKTLQKLNLAYTINQIGSMYSLFFTEKQVFDFQTAKTSNTEIFAKYFHKMLQKGVYLAPSQFESLFVSVALSDSDIEHILQANEESLAEIH